MFSLSWIKLMTLYIFIHINGLIGFDLDLTTLRLRWNNVDATLHNVVSKLFQGQDATLYQLCAKMKIRGSILFHFQSRVNVITKLIYNVAALWSDVEILNGILQCMKTLNQNFLGNIKFLDKMSNNWPNDLWKRNVSEALKSCWKSLLTML